MARTHYVVKGGKDAQPDGPGGQRGWMMWPRLRRHWRIAAVAGIALLGACRADLQTTSVIPEPSLVTLVVQPVEARREQLWDGVVEAVNQATITAQTSARVKELPLDVGDSVSRDDVLVRFTDVEQQSAQRSAAATVMSARAAYDEAKASWKRMDALWQRRAVTRAQLDEAVARRDASQAALAAAQAGLLSAEQQAEYTVVRAPFDGVVMRRFVEVGEAVQSGPPAPQPLIAIASLDNLRVDVAVPQSAVTAIRRFHAAAVLAGVGDEGRIAAARIIVFPYADPDSHTFRVRVELPRGTQGFYPGMTVKVAFTVGSAKRLLVPVSALVQRGEVSGVYVVGSDRSVLLRQLRLGHRYGAAVEVLSGLAAGERVATDPVAAALYLAALQAQEKA